MMGLASLPWLSALVAVCGKILHSVLTTAKQHAVLLGVFLVNLVKKLVGLCWTWVQRYWSTYLLLYTAIASLVYFAISSSWSVLSSFVLNIRQIHDGWQALLDAMPGTAWAFWNSDGLFRLSILFDGLWTNIEMLISTAVALFIITRVKFSVQILLKQNLGKVN